VYPVRYSSDVQVPLLTWRSDVHPVNGRDPVESSVRCADHEGSLWDVAHLSVVNSHYETEATTVDGAGVETVHDGKARTLPVSRLLNEELVGLLRVVWHAHGDEALVEVVALGPSETVHFL